VSDDTNLILFLKSGREVEVIYPLRVFTEGETPWLDRPGYLQTSDPLNDLTKFKSGNGFGYNPRFVIGTWMPTYNKSDNRVETIPKSVVENITPASAEAAARGNKIRQQEQDDRMDAEYPKGVVTRRELARLFPSLADQILTRPREENR
jgi:hypothetical protein